MRSCFLELMQQKMTGAFWMQLYNLSSEQNLSVQLDRLDHEMSHLLSVIHEP
jgi:hypothetical protein